VRKAVLADLVAQGDVLEVTRSLGGIVRLD
jgi:hypothetical protein